MKKKKPDDFERYKRQALKEPKFRKAFEEPDEDIFLETAYQLVMLRRKAGLTQSQLAKKLKISQQAVARLESLSYKGHSLTTLQKIAETLNKKLKLQFV